MGVDDGAAERAIIASNAHKCMINFLPCQITSLPEPYGKCEHINPFPVSECQLNCKTEKVVETCGCHDVHMKPQENVKTNGKLMMVKTKDLQNSKTTPGSKQLIK